MDKQTFSKGIIHAIQTISFPSKISDSLDFNLSQISQTNDSSFLNLVENVTQLKNVNFEMKNWIFNSFKNEHSHKKIFDLKMVLSDFITKHYAPYMERLMLHLLVNFGLF